MTKPKVILNFDGSCTNNKTDGNLGIGFHARFENETENIFEMSGTAGIGSSNMAEYKSLIKGMEELIKRGLTDNVEIYGDSQLIINQMNKVYACRDYDLRKLNIEANKLKLQFNQITFTHIPREENQLADELAGLSVKNTFVNHFNYFK